MRLVSRLSALTVALAFFAACGGDDTPTTPTPTVSVAATTTTATVTRGGTATYPITITRGGGYTGTVTLTASNLPADVQASFSPATLTAGQTTSTLTLTTGANAQAITTNNITITASGPNNTPTAQTTVSLTVNAPPASVALTVGANTAALTQGGTTTIPVNISRTNFNNPVEIVVSGLPLGVTASLNPASPLVAGVNATTVTLTATGAATTGPASVTITARDPSATPAFTAQTQTVALTVNPSATPGFTLTAGTAAITQVAGTTTPATSTITLARQGGFTGDVALAVTGAPTGLTATLNPTSLTGTTLTSTLNVSSTAAVTPGTYNLTITGTSAGQTARVATVAVTITAPPSIGLTLGSTALSVPAGGTATSTVTLARLGGLTGDITLTAAPTTGSLPTGMTISFTPAGGVVTGTNTTGSVTVTTTAATPPGTYNLTVRGTGANGVVGTAPLTVTVTQPAGITFTAANVSTAAGTTNATSAITITRAGGFTGDVTFALSGLPQGVTGTFSAVGTGNASTLTLNVPAGTAPGTYTGTITASGNGITTVTSPITLVVTGGTGGGGGNVAFRFCATDFRPTFFAFRNGTTGAWTPVTADASTTYSFTLTQNVGQVAYGVQNADGTVDMYVFYYTASEFPNIANQACLTNPATKSVSGTVAGLAAGQTATIDLGAGAANVQTNGAFTITNATAAASDLIATRTSVNLQTGSFGIDRVIVRRNVNPAPGGSIGPVLDFNSSEAVAPVSAQYTISNLAAGETVLGLTAFQTANGGSAGFVNFTSNTGSPTTLVGVPSTLTQAGDLHVATIFATSANSTVQRGIFQYNRELVNRTVTLGPVMTPPTITTIATAPYARLRTSGTWQTEYNDALSIAFDQGNGQRTWTISASRGFFGTGATYELDIPDLSGVQGFNNAWGLVAGQATQWTMTAYAGLASVGLTAPVEGTVARFAARTGTVTP